MGGGLCPVTVGHKGLRRTCQAIISLVMFAYCVKFVIMKKTNSDSS